MELAGFNDSLEKDKSVTSVQGWSKEKSAEALGMVIRQVLIVWS